MFCLFGNYKLCAPPHNSSNTTSVSVPLFADSPPAYITLLYVLYINVTFVSVLSCLSPSRAISPFGISTTLSLGTPEHPRRSPALSQHTIGVHKHPLPKRGEENPHRLGEQWSRSAVSAAGGMRQEDWECLARLEFIMSLRLA